MDFFIAKFIKNLKKYSKTLQKMLSSSMILLREGKFRRIVISKGRKLI